MSTTRVVERLAELSLRYRRWLLLAAALALGHSAVAVLLPWVAGRLVEGAVGSGGVPSLPALSQTLPLLALLGLLSLLSFENQYLIGRTEARVAADLRQELYDRLQSLPLRWLDDRRSGELSALLAVDVETAASASCRIPVALPALLITLLGSLAMMLRIDPWVAMATFVIVPPLYLVVRALGKPTARLSQRVGDAYGELLSLVQENLEHLLTIKSFGIEPTESARHRAANQELLLAREAHLRRQLAVSPATHFLAATGVVLVIALAGTRPSAAALAPGQLVSLLLYGLVLTRPVIGAAQVYLQLQEARAALRRLAGVREAAPESLRSGVAPTPRLRGAIEARGVWFQHPGRAPALSGLDLCIRPGELLALVGANGAGKTTLAHLLLRLHEVDAGTIQIDGQDLREIDPEELRRQIGLGSQQTQLFHRSVRDNIAIGKPGATHSEIRQAAEGAGVHAFIETLPEGYDTPIGERGLKLSGGQRQRIALARLLLKAPPILILDEATSMFDPRGEAAFLRRNRDWLRQRTVLLVTHRLESLAYADRVITIRDGRAWPYAPAETRPSLAPQPIGRSV